jgi:cbb3-type cytochrome oxidase subunit 3
LIIAKESGSFMSLIAFLGGGLLVLLIVFALVVVYLYRKFKRKF